MKQAPFTSRRWRRVEYERLIDLGAFDEDEPLELIGGQLIVAEPKGSEHATAVEMAGDALRAALPAGWIVRGQNPINLDDESAPELPAPTSPRRTAGGPCRWSASPRRARSRRSVYRQRPFPSPRCSRSRRTGATRCRPASAGPCIQHWALTHPRPGRVV